jgi:hypothetical protein
MLKIDWSDKVKYTKPTSEGKAINANIQNVFNGSKQKNDIQPKVERDEIKTSELQTILIIPDVHSYARDVNAYELCMESAKVLSNDFNVTKIILVLDFL